MMMQRRFLLAALPLGGCAGMTPGQSVAVIAADVATIADGLVKVLGRLKVINILPAATLDKVAGYAAAVVTLADTIAGVSTVGEAKPIVAKIVDYVNAIAEALLAQGAVPLPADVQRGIQAVLIILPLVQVAVGLAANRAVPSATEAAGARAAIKG